jgi:hypothetical protein
MTWLFIALCIAAGSGVTYGVVKRGDRNLLRGYHDIAPVRAPVLLIVDETLSLQVQTAVAQAAAFWNSTTRLPCLFTHDVMDIEGGGSIVPVMPYTGHESRRRRNKVLAYADLALKTQEGSLLGASIKINTALIDATVFELSTLTYAIAHEMGHVLGLAHDDAVGSVMWPTTRELIGPPTISRSDREIAHGHFKRVP